MADKTLKELNSIMQSIESSAYDLQLSLAHLLALMVKDEMRLSIPVQIPYQTSAGVDLFNCQRVFYKADSDLYHCEDTGGLQVTWDELSMDGQLEIIRALLDSIVAEQRFNELQNPGQSH